MSNEAQIRSSLQILKVVGGITVLDYNARPSAFSADVTGTKGPVPGAITATVEGTDVDFSELTTPSLCRMMNLSATNILEYGTWDPEGGVFYPLGELLPGETYPLRLSRNLQEGFGTGTGTTEANTNRLRLRGGPLADGTGDWADVEALVEAFER